MRDRDEPTPIEAIRSWLRRYEASRPTVVCTPEDAERVEGAVADAGGYPHIRVSPFCPPGTILVLPPTESLRTMGDD